MRRIAGYDQTPTHARTTLVRASRCQQRSTRTLARTRGARPMTRFDQLGERIAQEQDALRANAGYQAEVRARLAALEVPAAKPVRRAAVWLWSGAGVSAIAACVFVVAGL